MTTRPDQTTRRHLLGLLAGGAAVLAGGPAVLAGCAADGEHPTNDRPDGGAGLPGGTTLLLAETGDGLVAVRGDRVARYGPAAVATGDGGRVYATKRLTDDGADRTALLTFDPATDADSQRVDLDGAWVPRVTSADGRLVVLAQAGPPAGPAGGSAAGSAGGSAGGSTGEAGGKPAPRSRTPIVVAGPGGVAHRFDLAGNTEPDALAQAGHGLFVLEWLPAEAPDRYRVRLLDFATGTTRPLLTRDKTPVPAGAEEEMRGDGRQAVLSGTRDVLYTLYTHQPDHRHTRDLVAGRPGATHAFVHVLHLAQMWAYCLDLPHPFGETPAAGHALALSHDMRRLLVGDVGSGKLAIADVESLTVPGVVDVPKGEGVAAMAAGSSGQVFLASGSRLLVLDGGTGAVTATWKAGGEVRALAAGRDGTRLFVATTDRIDVLDAATGSSLGRVPLAGVTALRHIR